jgi:hypothetical protein
MVSLKAFVVSATSVLLAVSPTLVIAADCFNDCTIQSTESLAWSARQNYCGTNRWQTQTAYNEFSGSSVVSIGNSSPGANGQQVCWDAYENMIVQCRRNGHCRGVFTFNGVIYSMGF